MNRLSTEKCRNPLALSVMLALGISACGSGGEQEKRDCLSPAAVSNLYSGDRTETVTDDQTTWRLGAVITNRTTLRDADAYRGMVIGFGPTAGNTDGIEEIPPVGDPFEDANLSRPTPPEREQLLVKIGPDDVTFTARIQARAGSPDCNQPPNVEFGPATPLTELLSLDDPVLPDWPN